MEFLKEYFDNFEDIANINKIHMLRICFSAIHKMIENCKNETSLIQDKYHILDLTDYHNFNNFFLSHGYIISRVNGDTFLIKKKEG